MVIYKVFVFYNPPSFSGEGCSDGGLDVEVIGVAAQPHFFVNDVCDLHEACLVDGEGEREAAVEGQELKGLVLPQWTDPVRRLQHYFDPSAGSDVEWWRECTEVVSEAEVDVPDDGRVEESFSRSQSGFIVEKVGFKTSRVVVGCVMVGSREGYRLYLGQRQGVRVRREGS